jgi:hypothetical protein
MQSLAWSTALHSNRVRLAAPTAGPAPLSFEYVPVCAMDIGSASRGHLGLALGHRRASSCRIHMHDAGEWRSEILSLKVPGQSGGEKAVQ